MPRLKFMALAKVYSITRDVIATVIRTPQARGLVLNNQQVEQVVCTKSTGDTSGSFDLGGMDTGFARTIFVHPIIDSDGSTPVADPELVSVTFTKTDYNTIAVTGLGDWTLGVFYVLGRADI